MQLVLMWSPTYFIEILRRSCDFYVKMNLSLKSHNYFFVWITMDWVWIILIVC